MELLEFKRTMLQKQQKKKFKKIFGFVFPLQFNGKALIITDDMCQKVKLYNNDSYLMVKRERFLQGLE